MAVTTSAVPVPRIGVERPDSPQPVVAVAEARVIEHELGRRLGPITVDLRIDRPGDAGPVGPWAPVALADWPGAIDARLELGRLDTTRLLPLTALFARTVPPAAPEVRVRMLHHLGLLPREVVDDELLDALGRAVLRPTDVWLLVGHADIVTASDPAIAAFGTSPDDPAIAELDAAFDLVADDLAEIAAVRRSLRWERQRLEAVAEEWKSRALHLRNERERSEREAADRCDAMEAEIAVLRRRLAQAEASGSSDDRPLP